MALEFIRRAGGAARCLAILPGSFNPPTLAHVGLGRVALTAADEVLFVLPRVFPHKEYEGASFEQRVRMLEAAVEDEPHFSAAISEGGLFVEIALEARESYGPGTRLSLLCGRDAAERIVGWEYGSPDAVGRMLEIFDLLVAPRGGVYVAPAHLADRIRGLPSNPRWEALSATEVRRRAAAGEPWEHMVPPGVLRFVRGIYCVSSR